VKRCGLFIHEVFQIIGASPDGMIRCNCCGDGVLELKCPLCLAETDDFASLKYLQENNTSNFELKEKHPYFYQVQTQMFCTGKGYADFFIWSPKKHHQERIPRNPIIIIKEIVSSSLNFFCNSIGPELLGMYFTNNYGK